MYIQQKYQLSTNILLNKKVQEQSYMIEEEPVIDQNSQSRQLAVYGHKIQARLMAMKVYIHGITGLGIEVAKNLILAGPKSVTIHDQQISKVIDSGRNFYITEKYINKMTRAQACLKYLKQLNPNVQVSVWKSNKIEQIVSNHTCVVVLDNYDKDYLLKLNKACREKNVGFIYAGNLGLYGFTFVDYGDKHEVIDATGEQQRSVHLELITKDEDGIATLHEGKKHGLNDGDSVTFRQVKGMTELNDKVFKITVKSPSSFGIGDTSKFGDYTGGGIATEIKVPFYEQYYSLQKSLKYPYAPNTKQMPICNWQNFGVPEQLHCVLNGVLQYHSKHKRLPRALNKQDASELAAICEHWLKNKMDQQGFEFKVEQISKRLIDCTSLFGDTQISPVCSFWGGIITQQIIKLTGKYSPIRQWLHHQFFQIIDKCHPVLKGQSPKHSYLETRYADYSILFGDDFVEHMHKCNTFLIGAGALGCEFIKMFALMGMSTRENGRMLCTDDDNIQISNLNRQFLFRKNHVGKNKSQVACHIGKKINKQCKFQSVKLKVCPDTEEYFNDEFWERQNLIVNAVDNVKARQFIDDQCVWYEKPLFESGTLGTKCHSQIVIPHHTISYNDIIDPPQEQFAVCTLKLFPYQIQHTIQWARQYFETVIAVPSQDLQAFYANKNQFIQKIFKQNKKNPTIAKERVQKMRRLHQINETHSYLKCVQTAVRIFQSAFQNQIAQLLFAFPEDYVSPQTGKPYWSGLKRTPKVIKLNPNDKLHLQFIQATANILAHIFKIPQQKSSEKVKQLVSKIPLVQFTPKKKIKVNEGRSDDSAIQVQNNDEPEQDIQKIKQAALSIQTGKFQPPTPVAFQKDDPTNWHIQFMGGVSNLRARNYCIGEVDNFKVKLIAGKIIPAIATTTALIVGVVGIEIIKYMLKRNQKQFPVDYYRNVNVNLASSFFVFSYVSPAIEKVDREMDMLMGEKVRALPTKFTKWDKIKVKGPITLKELISTFEEKYGVQVQNLMYKATVSLYAAYGPTAKLNKQRLQMKVEDVVEQASKKKISKGKKSLLLQISNCRDKNGVFCQLPDIQYLL